MDIRDFLPLHETPVGPAIASLMNRFGKRLSRRPPLLLEPGDLPAGLHDGERVRALVELFLRRAELPGSTRCGSAHELATILGPGPRAYPAALPAALAYAVARRWRLNQGLRDSPRQALQLAGATALYLGFGVQLLNAAAIHGRVSSDDPERRWIPGEPLPEDPGGGGVAVVRVGPVAASTCAFALAVLLRCGGADASGRARVLSTVVEPQRAFLRA
jgi:hypothetical protein